LSARLGWRFALCARKPAVVTEFLAPIPWASIGRLRLIVSRSIICEVVERLEDTMRRLWLVLLLQPFAVTYPHAQQALTREQRIADLNQLAGFYGKNYGPSNGSATPSASTC
jgi:hypothetical protein